MRFNISKKVIAGVAGIVALTGVAYATVTFDPTTGYGFVGKGDVQLAFGWNDPKLQQYASGVSFSLTTQNEYEAVCTWVTGEGTRGEQTHNVNHTKTSLLIDSVGYEARKNSQTFITGFNLQGFSGVTTETGTTPVVGGPCPGNEGTDGTWSSVTETGSVTGLYVSTTLPSSMGPVLIWGSAL